MVAVKGDNSGTFGHGINESYDPATEWYIRVDSRKLTFYTEDGRDREYDKMRYYEKEKVDFCNFILDQTKNLGIANAKQIAEARAYDEL